MGTTVAMRRYMRAHRVVSAAILILSLGAIGAIAAFAVSHVSQRAIGQFSGTTTAIARAQRLRPIPSAEAILSSNMFARVPAPAETVSLASERSACAEALRLVGTVVHGTDSGRSLAALHLPGKPFLVGSPGQKDDAIEIVSVEVDRVIVRTIEQVECEIHLRAAEGAPQQPVQNEGQTGVIQVNGGGDVQHFRVQRAQRRLGVGWELMV